ncbi:UDP-N-acetylglucosamine 2-epimerase [Synergistaceae bacterium OttesenSCG-928-I11]|nr:UDP-N-acetylglucosamine 2-epimerase [Synergistaceae bacterium OttesenSCG-928-I11]
MKKLKIVFLTGSRADYGKLKSLIAFSESEPSFETYIYVSGMHLLESYGLTYREILSDNFRNIHIPSDLKITERMELNLARTIQSFADYVRWVEPDLIVVHGDRTDPLAGALVGIFRNIMVAHIEGGEVSGTVDELLRHAISKLSHLHFVSNEESKYRLLQLGEHADDIYVIGSPDVDIMLSETLPHIQDVKRKYNIVFEKYAICMYHPVTTDDEVRKKASELKEALVSSGMDYIVIYPNNDHGSLHIKEVWSTLNGNRHFSFFDSIRFEDFLALLKASDFIIGNSSAGVREACVYGVPSIDVGTRQQNRYSTMTLKNIQHADDCSGDIIKCIGNVDNYRKQSFYFGSGESARMFVDILKGLNFDKIQTQKSFVELDVTMESIRSYINEVCF